jgi:hypothetical protein
MAMNWALVETLLRPMVETHPSLATFYPLQCLFRLIWDQSLWDQTSMLIKAYMGPGSIPTVEAVTLVGVEVETTP